MVSPHFSRAVIFGAGASAVAKRTSWAKAGQAANANIMRTTQRMRESWCERNERDKD
jgi:hypothetical protein